MACKDMWVKEIKKVLMGQFDRIKGKYDIWKHGEWSIFSHSKNNDEHIKQKVRIVS
jgi:hypothetical protein